MAAIRMKLIRPSIIDIANKLLIDPTIQHKSKHSEIESSAHHMHINSTLCVLADKSEKKK